MYFKSIEMRGFKSFVDETVLTFEPGVTAIVGPNGCGKSNIADAIRWVLGEQSARHMRGARMDDFIFNGSGSRKPTGFAEVSLTISNSDGRVSAAPYAEYEEITVKRKLYRTGESEYYINKVPCRLKDIVDVFLDTGVSTRSLSIIEQGQITQIVNSKPYERRAFIEEAAGVMKFKNRRNAAMNKLSGAQQNLLRIQDILGELERQRNSLNRQAKKAERFKSYRNEIKEKALDHYSGEYTDHAGRLKELEDALILLREKESAVSAELSTRKNKIESLAASIGTEERNASELREERFGFASTIERNENHIDLLTRQIDEMATTHTEATDEIVLLEEKIKSSENESQEKEAEFQKFEGKVSESVARRDELEKETSDIRLKQDEKRSELDAKRREAYQFSRQISESAARMAEISAKAELAESRIEELAGKREVAKNTLSQSEAKVAESREIEKARRFEFEQERLKNSELQKSLNESISRLENEKSALRHVEDEITKLRSRLESLEELEKSMEGFGEGARGLIRLKDAGEESLRVSGLLIDRFRAKKPELEIALAAALGEKLEGVVLADDNALTEAVRLLKEGSIGRAILIADGLYASQNENIVDPGDHPSLIGRASDLVTFSDNVPMAAKRLMESIFVAKDLNGAMEIWRKNPGKFSVVTVEGELVGADGFVTGGQAPSGEGASIVARKRMIDELINTLSGLDAKKEKFEKLCDDIAALVETDKEALAGSSAMVKEIEVAAIEARQSAQSSQEALVRAKDFMSNLEADREKLSFELARFTADKERVGEEASHLTSSQADMGAIVDKLSEELDTGRHLLEEVGARLRVDEVALTELRGKLSATTVEIGRLENHRADLVNRLAKLKGSLGDNVTRREEMASSISTMRDENVRLVRDKDEIGNRLTKLTEALNEKTDDRESLDKEVRELEKEVEESRANIAEESLKSSELKIRVENIIEKADHEFNIPVEDLVDRDISEIDKVEAERRLAFLRGEISRIGDVNMGALEEFEEVDERFQFMKTQHADLVASIATLRKTIDSLNNTTRKMFMETFEEVSVNFKNVFQRLFGGGNAEMRLVQEEDKPEPGVEILVQPPGKKVQNINLLSAGEKAMTAIALLFSIFMKQPSPFCLLDEVDAPLDEANIFRFRDMLMEMTEKTQFIIITHSQKTMSFAERLYGVTQEEDGVSKVLAVELEDHRRDPAPLAVA